MNNLIYKVKNVIGNKWKEYKQFIRKSYLRNKTLNLRRERKSDIHRWIKPEELLVDWAERTKIIAEMIPVGSKIIEFGAGKMWLKRNLPPGCTYVASDIISRNPEILVCDLNKSINIDLSKFDTAVFSGVLEYVYDVNKVFNQLQPFINNILLSYACKEIAPTNRLERGWLSDYTEGELKEIFQKHNYEIVESKKWKGQSIFKLEKR